jgi:hypothetical protein
MSSMRNCPRLYRKMVGESIFDHTTSKKIQKKKIIQTEKLDRNRQLQISEIND